METLVRRTIHHDIHACQLTPDLSKDTDVQAVGHMWLEELEIGYILVLGFKRDEVLDLLQFLQDKRRLSIALGMNECYDC